MYVILCNNLFGPKIMIALENDVKNDHNDTYIPRVLMFIPFFVIDIILKVRPLIDNEVQNIQDESSIISFLYPAQNQDLIKKLSAKKVNAFGEYHLVCNFFYYYLLSITVY